MKLLIIFFSVLIAAVFTKPIGGNRILIATDKISAATFEKSYSNLLSLLKSHGFSITIQEASNAELFNFGDANCDHLMLFAPELSKWDKMSAKDIVEFVNVGGNVLTIASSTSKNPMRELVAEFGISLERPDSFIVDPNSSSADKSLLKISSLDDSAIISKSADNFMYKGIGHALNLNNSLVFPVVSASESMFSSIDTKSPEKKSSAAQKAKLHLVSALQARNNARMSFLGSPAALSNDMFPKNEKFINDLVSWTFQESKVLRVKSVKHYKRTDNLQLQNYRVTDPFVYEIDIEEYDGSSRKWKGFTLPKDDKIQLEIIMLDPYIRTNLIPSKKELGVFHTQEDLRLPDVYGVFTLKVQYMRHGYTYIMEKTTISIVPYRHNEYARFITAAYPYYASSFSMIASFYVFVAVYLYGSYAQSSLSKKNE